jgi:hypothetical protein
MPIILSGRSSLERKAEKSTDFALLESFILFERFFIVPVQPMLAVRFERRDLPVPGTLVQAGGFRLINARFRCSTIIPCSIADPSRCRSISPPSPLPRNDGRMYIRMTSAQPGPIGFNAPQPAARPSAYRTKNATPSLAISARLRLCSRSCGYIGAI